MSHHKGRSRVTAVIPQETRVATRATGASLPAASRGRAAQKLSSGAGGGDLSRLKQQLKMTGISGQDSDDEIDQFMSESRQQFQKMFSGSDLLSSRLPTDADLFKDRLGGPGLGALSGGNNGGGGRLAFGKAQSTLFKDPVSSCPPLNAPTPSLFKDSPLRSQRLGGSPSLLGNRPPLSQRLNMNMLDESGFENMMIPPMKDGPGSLTLPMNGSGSLLARMGSPQMSRPLAQSSMLSPMSSGALSRPGVQHTIQTSSSSSTTKLTSRGGLRGDVTHVERQEQQEQSTSDGTSGVQQTRAQKLETATISCKDGKTEVDARRAELAQQRTARQRADGSAEVSEQVRASGGTRRALLERTNSGSQRVQQVTGEDCDAQMRTALHISRTGDVTETGSQVIPYGGDQQVSGPLWRFFDSGPLIQPPGMKVRGKIQLQASRTILNYKNGQMPSIKNDQFAYEDSFGGSESESDDDFDTPALEGSRRALPSSAPSQAKHRHLPWKSRPALPAPNNAQLSKSPAESRRNKLALPWRQNADKTSSGAATSPSALSRALPWRPSVRPVSLAPSEASSEGADLEHADDVTVDVTEEAAAARRKRLHKIATELLTSERRYVKELHLIDQVFRVRVEEANRQHAMFDVEVPSHIFANIRSIHQFHRDHLLPKLEQRLKDWDNNPRIGDIMKGSAPFLKMYTEFVSGFSNSSSLICTHYSKTPRFAAVMEEIHEMAECGNLPLEHHMIAPVQRIPRYELLLRDYLKSQAEDSPDRPDTQRALELVTLAARHSNDTMKRNDKFKQLLEIQENISGGPDLVSPHRELIKEGKIMKISARSGDHQERYLFLFSDLLLLCSPRLINKRIISGPAYRLRAKFSIEGLQVLEGDNLETLNTFYVCGNQKNVQLYTQSSEERCAWLEALCEVVRRFYERKASMRGAADFAASELGRSAPQMAPVEGAVRCNRCDAAFSVIRRKHSCRACGEVVCGKCSGQKAALACEQGREVRVCDACYQALAGRREAPRPLRQTVLDATYTPGGGLLAMPASEPGMQSGELQLRCRRGWVKRFFVLRANLALYMYDSEKARTALAATPVPGFTVAWAGTGRTEAGLQEKDRDRAFKLSLSNRSYTFLAESRDSAARWIAALQKASRAEIPMPGQVKP